TAGSNSAIKTAMMAMTTRSSMSVKPPGREVILFISGLHSNQEDSVFCSSQAGQRISNFWFFLFDFRFVLWIHSVEPPSIVGSVISASSRWSSGLSGQEPRLPERDFL